MRYKKRYMKYLERRWNGLYNISIDYSSRVSYFNLARNSNT